MDKLAHTSVCSRLLLGHVPVRYAVVMEDAIRTAPMNATTMITSFPRETRIRI